MKDKEGRKSVAYRTAECLMRGLTVNQNDLLVLAEEAKLAFAETAAGHAYLEAIMTDGVPADAVDSRLALMEVPPDVTELSIEMNKEQKMAFLALYELRMLRAEADALGYWRMPR